MCQEWVRCTDPPSVQGKPAFSLEVQLFIAGEIPNQRILEAVHFLLFLLFCGFVYIFSLQIH